MASVTVIESANVTLPSSLSTSPSFAARCPFESTSIPEILADVPLMLLAVPIRVHESPDPPKCVRVSVNFPAGKFTETLTHFGGSGDSWTRIGTASNINGTSASISGILVDSNGHLAANEGEVDKLEGRVTFADSITVTDATTSLTMSFNLGEGMSLNSGGGDSIYIGSGPFQAIMSTN